VILLDTNIISELMRQAPDSAVVAWVDDQPASHLFVSAVTRAEIELGIALLPDGQRRAGLQAAAVRMLGAFAGRCLPFDEPAAVRYGQIVAARSASGRPISVEDAQIAATAVSGGLTLATRNGADFAGIEGLAVVDPFRAGIGGP
jgi:toxin FitB